MNYIYHHFCLQICHKVTSMLWRSPKDGINRKALPHPAVSFDYLCGELYNADRKRGFSLSSTCLNHLFLNSPLVLHLHQSVEWFKWMKETRLALNKLLLICGSPFYFVQFLDSFTWPACWKHSSLSLQGGDGTQQHTRAQAGTPLWSSAGCRLLSHSGTKIPVYLSHKKI